MNKLFFLLIITLAISCADKSNQQPTIDYNKKLDTYFSNLSIKGFSGAILIEQNDSILLKKGYAIANHEEGTRVTDRRSKESTRHVTKYHL